MALTLRERITAEKARRSLYEFARQAWHVIANEPFFPGWHLEATAEHLEAVTRGHIRKLILNMPPRCTKSTLINVIWNCWEWIQDSKETGWASAHTQWFCFSYSSILSERDADYVRRILSSEWFQLRWGHVVQLSKDKNTTRWFENSEKGRRISSSIEGFALGEGGDRIVVSDPHHGDEVHHPRMRQNVIDWWTGPMSTRGNNPATVARVIEMQRLHPEDLCAYLINNDPGWEVFKLPMSYVPGKSTQTVLGFIDRRQEEGELLFSNRHMKHPEDCAEAVGEKYRFTQQDVDDIARNLKDLAPAQLQQEPLSEQYKLFSDEWFQTYNTLPEGSDWFFFWSWDMNFKLAPTADYVAGLYIGYYRTLGHYYVLDRIMDRMEYTDAKEAVRRAYKSAVSHRCSAILIEESANGHALLSDLRGEKYPVADFNVRGEPKMTRWRSLSSVAAERRIFMPAWAPWVYAPIDGLVSELIRLPLSTHDDQSDALANAVIWNEQREFDLREEAKGTRLGTVRISRVY